MQAVVSGQAAIGVAVSAIQLLSALASVKSPASEAARTEERGAEARSAFAFFSLSTVFYILSAGAYAWLTKTPEYRAIKDGHGTRRISLSMSQSFTADDEGTGLVSEQAGDMAHNPVARTIGMMKTNLAFNFAVAWVFVVTLVCGEQMVSETLPDTLCSLCSRRSPCPYFRWTLQPIVSSSVPFTFLSTTWETSWDDPFVRGPR
jgi:hypothetical protein